ASIHNEQARTLVGARAMRLGAIGDLVAHARCERERAPVGKIGAEFAIYAEQDVPFLTPMIGDVARRILDKPQANVAELPGPPSRNAAITPMQSGLNARPVGGPERDVGYLHHFTARWCRCGGSFSVTAGRHRAAPPQSAGNPAHRYQLERCDRSRAPRNKNSDSSRRRLRTTPSRSRSAARASGRRP